MPITLAQATANREFNMLCLPGTFTSILLLIKSPFSIRQKDILLSSIFKLQALKSASESIPVLTSLYFEDVIPSNKSLSEFIIKTLSLLK